MFRGLCSHHDGVGEVSVGLTLQTHSGEFGRYITLWGGFVQGRLPDPSHLSGHEEGEHALEGGERKEKLKNKPQNQPEEI